MPTTQTSTDLRMTSVAFLRSLASDAGLGDVLRVRKGTGCRRGAIHVDVRSGATRDQRVTAYAFLCLVRADVVGGLGSVPEHFDSATVVAYDAP